MNTAGSIRSQLHGPTVKHGGENVKCWGSFSSSSVENLVFIDENMTGEVYRDILQRNLFEAVKKD